MIESGTIADVFFATAGRFPERPFLHAASEAAADEELGRRDYAYCEARAAIDSLIVGYDRLGVGRGHRVGLLLDNRPAFFLHLIAVNALGASAAPFGATMPASDLAYRIGHSECAVVVVPSRRHEAIIDALKQLPEERAPLVVTPGLSECGRVAQSPAVRPTSDPRLREAALIYTSGTTGAPKGCILSNDYFLAIADLYVGLGGDVSFDEGSERIITPLPTTHMNALACSFMATIATGGCLIQLDRFHPKTWWATVRESGATIIHYLGVMPAMLLGAPPSPDDDFSGQIKFAFGAGCDPRHHAQFESRFGVKLIEAWAMTETGAGAWIAAAREPRHVGTRCFGRAPKGLEWKIVDEAGRAVAPEEAGELLVRRAGADPRRHFFSGYLKDEAATEEAWKYGWFHTGDAVRVDADGNFYFVDRLKNVIRRSGENIAAIEVESVLTRHEGVAGCVVVAIPDEVRGDEVMALVLPADGNRDKPAARAIFDFALANLAYFKAPRYVAFVDALPTTASEKIKRGDAREIGRRLLECGAAFDFSDLKKSRKG